MNRDRSTRSSRSTPSSADRLGALHKRTDARFSRTVAAIGSPVGCGSGCFSCCVDQLTVWLPEADAITAHVRDNELTITPHPPGRCVFLHEGRCQVYAARPYVCRSQGAVLRFWSDRGEERDTCPEHLQGVDLASLPDEALFDLGPAEQELAAIASSALGETGGSGLPTRLALRDLAMRFTAHGASSSDQQDL